MRINRELLSAKRRQVTAQKIMRLPVPYKVRLEAVAMFGTKSGKFWP